MISNSLMKGSTVNGVRIETQCDSRYCCMRTPVSSDMTTMLNSNLRHSLVGATPNNGRV